ncbi:GNAT family N-acetyltransferase [Acrocarpospora catenulata]|uniref:GNAT family N-acetyltransferase n=1 Tax=Acrocarpospora catenulata TaxID=2836182 RepID=UPI001BDA1A16|nr:GNAT family N-acetyltransferase [Acrocarpospora catenulata]
MDPIIRPFTPADIEWAAALLTADFGALEIVSRGVLHDPTTLPGFVAELDGTPKGLLIYHPTGSNWEVIVLNAPGLGAPLLTALTTHATTSGCHRLWLTTTNDNTRALRFYQRRGWNLIALHLDAVTTARHLKPAIPELGNDNIPIRHELELELLLP